MASASEILKAYLHCARTPAEDAVERIRTQLKKQYGAAEVELTVSVEPDLISGYVLQVGGRVFDNSGKSALAAITADAPSLAVMQTRVEDYKPAATTAEGGTVISAADGVVDVKGMDQAVYGEIVTFDNGAKGMVESVEPDHLVRYCPRDISLAYFLASSTISSTEAASVRHANATTTISVRKCMPVSALKGRNVSRHGTTPK